MQKVAVVMGGPSAEREVSLNTGRAVVAALTEKKYDVTAIDLGEDIVDQIKQSSCDCVFVAVHGKFGEDGVLQGILELLHIPYTGCGVLSSAMAMDKGATKKIFQADGVPTPQSVLLSKHNSSQPELNEKIRDMGLPLVIKPAAQGSSIGISFVYSEQELAEALNNAFAYGSDVLVEQYIKGRELTVGVLGNDVPQALPVIEIVPKSGRYDYNSKYTTGATDYLVPASLPADLYQKVQQLAVQAFQSLGCRGIGRADLLMDANHNIYVLEINTIPGMTATSLVPKAAAAAGISFPDLCEKMLLLALENQQS